MCCGLVCQGAHYLVSANIDCHNQIAWTDQKIVCMHNYYQVKFKDYLPLYTLHCSGNAHVAKK